MDSLGSATSMHFIDPLEMIKEVCPVSGRSPRATAAGNRGYLTLELMMALAIMVIVLTGVVSVAYTPESGNSGVAAASMVNQSMLTGAQTNAEAMNKAQGLLEQEQAEARKDFNLVNPIASTTDDIYQKAVYVRLLSDFLTKEVRALVTWPGERGITHSLELTTLISNFETPVGGNTCDSTLTGNWATPTIENSVTDFGDLIGDPGGTYTLSDVDAYQNKLYVTASDVSGPTNPTFFIFDISNPANPILQGSMDNEGPGGTVSAGLNVVRVSQDPASAGPKTFAFAGNANAANYATCDPVAKKNCGQLAVFNVTNPSSPQLEANLMIASSSAPFVTGNWKGNVLFYRNGYLILGLAKSGGTGPEFHLIDMHDLDDLLPDLTDPISKNILHPIGSFTTGHDINAVGMRGMYAYLTMPNDATDKELQILNLTTPSAPTLAGGYDMSGGGNGKSLYLVGNRLYFGNTVPSSGNDLHVLDNTSPNSTLPAISGTNLASSLNAMIVRSNLAFAVTNTDLEIFDIGEPGSVAPFVMSAPLAALSLPASGSATEPSMDCEGNRMYITSNDGTGRGALSVIKPGT